MTPTPTTATEWLQRHSDTLLGTYAPPSVVLARGEGSHLWDVEGNQYLDLVGGIAVNALGHAPPELVVALSEQLRHLGHISNLYTSPQQIQAAERILETLHAPAGSQLFFSNSGAEAVEAAVKFARAWGQGSGKRRFLALEGGFHGRTMGALSLTHKLGFRKPFEPLLPEVQHLPFGHVEALEKALAGGNVAALILEPIQGEAGVRPLPPGYLAAARELTRTAGALLIADEIQTGVGRTGEWTAYPRVYGAGYVVERGPDILTLAKGLGSGFPIGATIITNPEVRTALGPGSHGSTFGGNPLAARAALTTLTVIERQGLLGAARERGEQLRTGLAAVGGVREVRGSGLLIGVDVHPACAQALVTCATREGFLLNATGPATIRLAPPLILSRPQAQCFIQAFPRLLEAASSSGRHATAQTAKGGS